MYENFYSPYFLLGLAAGSVPTLIVSYFIWNIVMKKGKKERRFDERYKRIQEQAKSFAFGITLVAIWIVGTFVYIFEGPGLPFFLFTVLFVIAMVSYGVTATIMEKKN